MRLADLYLLLVRLFLGFTFAAAGLCKLTAGEFGQLIGPPTADMVPGLASIWPFLAVSQVLVGALVLSGRWALTGLLALVPLNVGILAYTIGNDWGGTSYVNAFFVGLNLLALAAEWPSLRFLLLPEAPASAAPPRLVQLWPGWRLPALALLLLSVAALSGAAGAPVVLTGIVGTLGIAAAWAHAVAAPALTTPDRVALGLPGLAVLWLSLTPVLHLHSVVPVMLLGLIAGTLAVFTLTVRYLRMRPIVNG